MHRRLPVVETRIGYIEFVAAERRAGKEWVSLERFAEMLRAQS